MSRGHTARFEWGLFCRGEVGLDGFLIFPSASLQQPCGTTKCEIAHYKYVLTLNGRTEENFTTRWQ
jgi:hypothetical protein